METKKGASVLHGKLNIRSLKPFQITAQHFQLGCSQKHGNGVVGTGDWVYVTQMAAALQRFDRHNWKLLLEIGYH